MREACLRFVVEDLVADLFYGGFAFRDAFHFGAFS